MRNSVIISLLFLCLFPCFGQNLVPNGDFELGPNESSEDWANGVDSNCNILGFVGGPTSWTVTSSSPDRLFEGDIECGWDNDTASSGSAYVMLGYGSFTESGKATLTSPLMVDSAYHLSCYLQLETARSLTIIPSRLSFLFNNNGDSIATPMVSDSTNWLYYDTTFIATASSTEIEIMNSGGLSYGVKLDNIILEKTTLTSIQDNRQCNKMKIYPNPAFHQLTIQYPAGTGFQYSLYTATGCLVEAGSNLGTAITINIDNLPSGLYILMVQAEEKRYSRKVMIS